MKILKVTEESGVSLPEEHLMFQDIFDSFNAPGLWLYTKENGQKGPFGLVQDGHNTILLYDTNESELKWKPIKEDGAYLIEAEVEGEGGVIIPHLAEIEVDIYLDGKKYLILVKCDASSSDALHIALKSTTPINFFRELKKRIRDIVTTMYISGDMLGEAMVGQELPLPENAFQVLMKFGMLGLRYEGAKILTIEDAETPDDVKKEFEVYHEGEVEEIDEAFIPDIPKIEEEVETPTYTEKPRGPPAVTRTKTTAEIPSAQASGTPSQPPTPKKPPAPSVPSAKAAAPPSPAPPSPAPPSPAAETVQGSEEELMPRARRSKKRVKPALPSMPGVSKEKGMQMSRKVESKETLDDLEEEEDKVVLDEMIKSERKTQSVAGLTPESMPTDTEENILKSIKTRWHDRMVVSKTYPVDVTISTEVLKVQKTKSNIISGERETEKIGRAVVDLNKPVTVRAIFPGCITQPSTRLIDPKTERVSVRFYVTPLSKGTMECKIVLEQDDLVVSEMDLPTKVIDHRVAKLVAIGGAAISGIPASVGYAINGTVTELLSTKYLPLYGGTVGLLVGAALAYFLRNKSKSNDKSTTLTL